MVTKPKPPPDDPEQSKRFIEAARKAEADETEDGARRAFKKVALPKGGSSRGSQDRKI